VQEAKDLPHRAGQPSGPRLQAIPLVASRAERDSELPDDATLAAALGTARRASSTVSSAEPLREVVQHWFDASVQGRAIHAALKREHGYQGRR
jgi:hypothetical protein